MKLYFLVEGISSELKAYPQWIKAHVPSLTHHQKFSDFKEAEEGVYFFSGAGYPSMLDHVVNCAHEINIDSCVDYFFVILDCDDENIETRYNLVKEKLDEYNFPDRLNIIITIQKRCFETILMGNKVSFPRQPQSSLLRDYYNYYDIINDDPELMGHYSDDYNHAKFHAKYAIHAFRERRINYSKSNPSAVSKPEYFEKISERVKSDKHLQCMLPFIEALEEISAKLN